MGGIGVGVVGRLRGEWVGLGMGIGKMCIIMMGD